LQAEKAALRLIARAEQNTFNLSRKLEKHGYETDCIRQVILNLCDKNLLDDRRYSVLWLESNINFRTTTPRRLFAALIARGIDRDDAEYALAKVLDEETETALLNRYAEKLKRKKNIKLPIPYLLKTEGFSRKVIQIYKEQITENN